MFFNSLHFAIFLPLVVAIYYLLPPRRRWMFMLAASYYFYMCWKVEYVVLIAASTVIDYWASLRMANCPDRRGRRPYLAFSLVTNLGLLFAFKYFNFINESARAAFQHFNLAYSIPYFNVLLPAGISFYTFQTLSYTIDVYRGHTPAERHLGIFALYVSFFPQLVAGPIERSGHLLPQMRQTGPFEYNRTISGLKLIMWGMFKKVVIADRVGVMVATIFANPRQYSGIEFILGACFFAYQVYCDFSAYSDIAIGSAKIFNVDLMENFRRPFHARTLGQLWSRWHISLTTWFRDYLYIPLGGSRRGKPRAYLNVMTIFLVSGFWHGAAWTYVIWGAIHGLFMAAELATASWRARLRDALRLHDRHPIVMALGIAYTMTVFNFALLIFRAHSTSDAFYMISHLFDGVGEFATRLLSGDLLIAKTVMRQFGLAQREIVILVAAILILETAQVLQRRGSLRLQIAGLPMAVRWSLWYGLTGAVLFLGAFNMSTQFIYFQF